MRELQKCWDEVGANRLDGDRAGALDTWFAVTGGVGDRSPRDSCIIYLLKSNPLIPRRSQLTSAVSPDRYVILMPR